MGGRGISFTNGSDLLATLEPRMAMKHSHLFALWDADDGLHVSVQLLAAAAALWRAVFRDDFERWRGLHDFVRHGQLTVGTVVVRRRRRVVTAIIVL